MTDHDLAVAAWGEFSATTDSYPTWVKKGRPASSHWAKGKAFLDQITANPSGQVMPIGDLPGWHQVFTDDFTVPVVLGKFPAYPAVSADGRWTAYGEGWKDTSKNGTYSPSRGISVHDSVLDVFLYTDSNGDHVVNNPVPVLPGTMPFAPMIGGRFAARWKVDPVPGYKIAWLLWPDSQNWPTDGEIDFPETIPDLRSTVQAYMHRQAGTSGSDQDAYDSHVAAAGAWHTSVVEWMPMQNTCAFYLDGALVGRSSVRVPNTGMSWRMQCETNTDPTQPPAATAQGHVLIDWVTIYELGSVA